MKKTMNFTMLSVTMLTVTLLIAVSSCNKDPEEQKPDLPSAELLFMDYSDFIEQPAVAKATVATYDNFIYAFGTVLFWHSPAITVYTALPVAAYKVALAQEAVDLGDNTWQWSYEVPLGEQTYVVTLTASRINNEEFSIEMDVALASLPNLGVRWFDGTVRYDHTYATWTIYKDGAVAVVEAEMHADFEAENASLLYTYVEPEMEETGSYILYAWDAQEVYDASYTVSLSTGMTQIEWSIGTKEGHVKDETYYQDADWHCWDSLANGLADKICE